VLVEDSVIAEKTKVTASSSFFFATDHLHILFVFIVEDWLRMSEFLKVSCVLIGFSTFTYSGVCHGAPSREIRSQYD
jgi:hypothetical protein